MKRFRFGQYLQDDVDYLNDRATIGFETSSLVSDTFMPALTTCNQWRHSYNKRAIREYSQVKQEHPFRYEAELTGRVALSLSQNQRNSLKTLSDDKTNRLLIVLDLHVGAPYQIPKNINTSLLMANGSLCIIVALQQHPDNIITVQRFNDGTSILPDIVFCKLIGVDIEIVQGLGVGIVPIFWTLLKRSKSAFQTAASL